MLVKEGTAVKAELQVVMAALQEVTFSQDHYCDLINIISKEYP